MTTPNVLLLMTDQQRWDSMSCMGGPVETVNMDWLAAQGTSFTSAYSATPSCVPARASLMTGMHPWHTGILGMGAGQPGCANLGTTLAGELAQAGYHTQGVGKMHFSPQRALHGFHNTVLDESARVIDPGFMSDYARWFQRNAAGEFDRYGHGLGQNSWMARPYDLPEWMHATSWTAAESIRFLERRDPTRPFFLKTSFARPHSPYDPPPFYFDLYHDRDLPAAEVGDWASGNDVRLDAANPDAWRGRRSPAETHRARAGYYGSINHIDHQIGRLLQHLRTAGLYENTVIVFVSDHGDMLGDHHLWRKTYAYEGSAHIPMIVRLPGTDRADIEQVVDEPVCLQDIMPTILDAVGADIPPTVDGASLLPLMRGEQVAWRPYVHGEHGICYSAANDVQFLTDGRWKYIWYTRTDQQQLFDLTADPYEKINLVDDQAHAPEAERWRRELVDVLSAREAGLTDDGRLVCQVGRPPLMSPHAAERRLVP